MTIQYYYELITSCPEPAQYGNEPQFQEFSEGNEKLLTSTALFVLMTACPENFGRCRSLEEYSKVMDVRKALYGAFMALTYSVPNPNDGDCFRILLAICRNVDAVLAKFPVQEVTLVSAMEQTNAQKTEIGGNLLSALVGIFLTATEQQMVRNFEDVHNHMDANALVYAVFGALTLEPLNADLEDHATLANAIIEVADKNIAASAAKRLSKATIN